jgi:threonyl-tRNA synthetase
MSATSSAPPLDNTGPSGESKPADSPIEIYRHSSAHLLAAAVTELFPDAQCGIGPPTDDGFFYDFLVSRPFTPEDLVAIEKKMAHIVRQNRPIEKKLVPKAEALELFARRGQTLKCELIRDKSGDPVQCYTMGEFVDFCLGPHLPSTKEIKAFKLKAEPAAAYWRGKEGNPSMQRIYGYAFFTKEELDQHLFRLEEAKRRDHRKLGRELDLFSIADETGAGLVLWHPKGGFVRKQIEDYWRDEHLAGGYDLVYSPHIARLDLWKTSGHTEYYKANMYSPIEIENALYQLKPMNCPFHLTIYKSRLRSYRDLPYRWAELGTVYRFERSGVLHGLMRVRGFTQDDAHIFCRPDQLEEEILRVLDFVTNILRTFGFDRYDIYLSTKPEKASGSDEQWAVATEALRKALESRGLPYVVDPGEGVFYGPKIDIKIKDALDRSWQCSTIQVDFHNPARFELEYVAEDGRAHQPVMVHRALLGSLERFFGVLVEHYAGAFPLWLAPVQAVLLPVAERHQAWARDVAAELARRGLRARVDDRSEKLGYKIREAQLQKVPYMLVVGDKEVEARCVSVRHRHAGDLGPQDVASFAERVARLSAERAVREEESKDSAGGVS